MPQQRTEAPASTAAKRCVIYCRKSSSEGLDRNYTSIDAQRDTCLRFIESHAGDGWQYTGQVFEDGGFSGGTTDRPAFQRMMRDVRNGEIDIIVIYKLDRINRNKRDFWNIEHELRQHGVEIACATQSIELKTSTGRATTGIMMDFAELSGRWTPSAFSDSFAPPAPPDAGPPPQRHTDTERTRIRNSW